MDTGSQEPNSLSVELGFRIPIISRILDSKAQDFRIAEAKFPGFRNHDYRGGGFIPQDHLDHGPSKKPTTPLSDGMNCWWLLYQMGLMFLWCTIIRVILTHNSWSGSSERNCSHLKHRGNSSPSSIMVVPCITVYFYSEKKIKSPSNIIRRNAVIGPLRLEVRWPILNRIEKNSSLFN